MLSKAVGGGDWTAATGLLESGADPSWAIVDAARRGDTEGLSWLFDRGAVAAGRPGTRALLWALRTDNPELAALLRAHGADLNGSDPSGITLLMSTAAATTKERRANHVLSALLDAGADPNAGSLAGRTALLFAVKANRLKAIQRLLEAGAEVDVRDRDGWTPLMLAARDGLEQAVEDLLEAGADPNVRSAAGWTPLMWAAWWGHLGIVESLLAAGADPNQSSYVGGTALIRAVQTGRRLVVLKLLSAGASRDGELGGVDALGWARVGGRSHLVRVLKRSGRR